MVRAVAWADDGCANSSTTLDGRPAPAGRGRPVRPAAPTIGGAGPHADPRVEPEELERSTPRAHSWSTSARRQRAAEGELVSGLVVERNVLEWRFDLGTTRCPR